MTCYIDQSQRNGTMDKTKEWQMEMLMEKLRSKAGQYRTFFESAKALRMTMLEKRYSIDNVERAQLQKCLDTLQQNMKVTSHQAMVERLESVSRQLGLKCVSASSGSELFISSDMFYLEVQLEPSGGVKDVKIHHEGRSDQQPQSCEELVSCLSRRDFNDFTLQLEGLSSIYQLNAEKKIKSKAYTALTSLETDLATIASVHSFVKDPQAIVHQTPLGYLEKRRGGHPLKLTYFIPPYELLDSKQRCMKPLILEPGFNLGFSVSVCVESSSAHKLQTAPLATISRTANGNTEIYASLTGSNSMTVAGCFVLTLNKPMPVCVTIVEAIQEITRCQVADLTTSQPLLSLVTQNSSSDPHTDPSKGLFVNIGDQTHCYLMTESRELKGVMVNSVSLTHPSHIPKIIGYLRQQALFNTIIASCVRPNARQDIEKMIMLEVTPLTWQHLSVSLEHPLEECMATVELDLRDVSNLTCKVYTSSGENSSGNSDYATKVFQKSLSIPVTLRSLIRLWNLQAQRLSGFYNGVLGGGSGDGTGGGGGGGSLGDVEFDPDIKIKLEPGVGLGTGGFGGKGGGSGGAFDCDDEASEKDTVVEEEERRSRKRKRRDRDSSWNSPKSNRYEDSLDGADSSSCDSTSQGTPASSNTNTLDFVSASELTDLVEKPVEMEQETEEEVKIKKKRKEEKKTAADILLDLENKNLVPPSVSITPISSSQLTSPSYSVLSEMGLERRPGIEIIPLSSSTTAAPLPSSITITPIPSSGSSSKSDDRKSDKKSSKSKSDKLKLEKKKKRKREDSPSMGPPEKIPSKSSSSDPLNKPVTVSIKPAESLSPRPGSPAVSRKYSSSPTHTSPLALSVPQGKSSPTPSSKSVKASPKHSPAYSTSSPKNSLTSSPKHGTSSPKHQSTSGKPSMSALKSAVTSPSKSESKGKTKDGKDRDKKSSSSGYPSPKSKSSNSSSTNSSSSSSVKVKQLDMTGSGNEGSSGSGQSRGSVSPSGDDNGKNSATPAQIKNRKSSLSAVIDKLKSAHHVSDEQPKDKRDSKERASSSSSSSSGSSSSSNKVDSKVLKPGETKSGEYSVKQSSDGIKLTINKTKSKESSKSKSSSSSSSSDSPKSHSGLKVSSSSSGPASKKLPHSSQKSGLSIKSSSSSSSKSGVKSSSSSSSSQKSVKSSGSPKTGDSRNKDKNRINKEKSIFSSSKSDSRKSSPSGVRDESDYKSFASSITISPQLGETGKQLDRNYQIPKLSSRDGDKKRERTESPKTERESSKYTSSKNEDGRGGGEQKSKSYYSSEGGKTVSKLPMDLSDSPTISIIPVQPRDDRDKGGGVDDIFNSIKMDLPLSSISLTPLNQDKDQEVTKKEVSELLLDLTGVKPPRKATPPLFPGSPSVSVHIVKSPAPTSPLVITTSPHSASPSCIDDDELMDEALVGITK